MSSMFDEFMESFPEPLDEVDYKHIEMTWRQGEETYGDALSRYAESQVYAERQAYRKRLKERPA